MPASSRSTEPNATPPQASVVLIDGAHIRATHGDQSRQPTWPRRPVLTALIFGTDWPVCTMVASHRQVVHLARIFETNACRVYGIA